MSEIATSGTAILQPLTIERVCKCPLCEEGRFIKRVVALLPEVEAKELNEWYCALLDHTCDKEMSVYWIIRKLQELQQDVRDFTIKKT